MNVCELGKEYHRTLLTECVSLEWQLEFFVPGRVGAISDAGLLTGLLEDDLHKWPYKDLG